MLRIGPGSIAVAETRRQKRLQPSRSDVVDRVSAAGGITQQESFATRSALVPETGERPLSTIDWGRTMGPTGIERRRARRNRPVTQEDSTSSLDERSRASPLLGWDRHEPRLLARKGNEHKRGTMRTLILVGFVALTPTQAHGDTIQLTIGGRAEFVYGVSPSSASSISATLTQPC